MSCVHMFLIYNHRADDVSVISEEYTQCVQCVQLSLSLFILLTVNSEYNVTWLFSRNYSVSLLYTTSLSLSLSLALSSAQVVCYKTRIVLTAY